MYHFTFLLFYFVLLRCVHICTGLVANVYIMLQRRQCQDERKETNKQIKLTKQMSPDIRLIILTNIKCASWLCLCLCFCPSGETCI